MNSLLSEYRDWKEWRRMRALALKTQGWTQRSIAKALGVSEQAVGQWLATARRGGSEALRSHPAPGAKPRLTAAQKNLIPEFLWHGPRLTASANRSGPAKVIEEEFGVSYHRDHVGRLLAELHWTPQVPIRRAIQRDEGAIQQWRDEVWPGMQRRARRECRVLVFEDESGFYLLPGLVRTYAPEAHTPVIREKQTRDHLSVMGGMTPAGQGLHAGATGVVERVAQHRVPPTLAAHRRVAVAGDLGWLAHPPPVGSQRIRVGYTRQGMGGGPAWLRSGPEPLGRRGLASPQKCGDAKLGVPGFGGVASGIPPCHRPPSAEAPVGQSLLCTGWITD